MVTMVNFVKTDPLPMPTRFDAHRISEEMSAELIFYNLKKPQPISVIFGVQYPNLLHSKSINNNFTALPHMHALPSCRYI